MILAWTQKDGLGFSQQPQLSWPFFTGEELQPSEYPHGPPVDLLQQLHVFLELRATELNIGLWVGSHKSRIFYFVRLLKVMALY